VSGQKAFFNVRATIVDTILLRIEKEQHDAPWQFCKVDHEHHLRPSIESYMTFNPLSNTSFRKAGQKNCVYRIGKTMERLACLRHVACSTPLPSDASWNSRRGRVFV
jgi:hypothetical protein